MYFTMYNAEEISRLEQENSYLKDRVKSLEETVKSLVFELQELKGFLSYE